MNLKAVDADSTVRYLKSTGAGTDADPLTLEHVDSSTLAAVQEVRDRLPVTGGASEATLAAIDAKLADVKAYTDGLETLAAVLNGYVDGLEALLTSANASQAAISGFVDQVEPKLDTISGRLSATGTASEATVAAINDKLADLKTYTDGIESLVNTVISGQVIPSVIPTLYTITLTNANQEYSQVFINARSFSFQILSGGDCRYAYESGNVATSILPYYPLRLGTEEVESLGNTKFSGTLYLASDSAGTIVIVKVWG